MTMKGVSAACAAPSDSLLMHGGNDGEEEAGEEGSEEVDREEDEEEEVAASLNSREGRAREGPPLVVSKPREARAFEVALGASQCALRH